MKKENNDPKIKILSDKEKEQDIEITMAEIEAEKECKERDTEALGDKEIKASVDTMNPDEGSMDSRG